MEMNRRGFVTGTVAAASVAAIGGIAVAAADEATFDAAAAFTPEAGHAWEIVPEDVPAELITEVVDADIVAIGLIRRLLELGVKLPENLSIVGFDDIQPAQYIYPPLTTVRQDIKEKATLAANAILEAISAPPKAKKSYVLEPTLTLRSSTEKAKD